MSECAGTSVPVLVVEAGGVPRGACELHVTAAEFHAVEELQRGRRESLGRELYECKLAARVAAGLTHLRGVAASSAHGGRLNANNYYCKGRPYPEAATAPSLLTTSHDHTPTIEINEATSC